MDNYSGKIENLRAMLGCILQSRDFSKLAGKSMMVDNPSTTYTRNRLTHTMDVTIIARRLARETKPRNEEFELEAELGGLMHDIRTMCIGT
jgi:dGTP triphosphohydrolase